MPDTAPGCIVGLSSIGENGYLELVAMPAMRVELGSAHPRPRLPLEWNAIQAVSTRAERCWDRACLALIAAMILLPLCLGGSREPWEHASRAVQSYPLIGLLLLGRQAERRLRWRFGLRQVWPMLLWMAAAIASAALAAAVPHWTWAEKAPWIAIVCALLWLALFGTFRFRGLRRPAAVEAALELDAAGVHVFGRSVPWRDVRYYAGTIALTIFGPGREFLCAIPRRNLPGSKWLDLEAELGLHAVPVAA